MVIFCSSVKKGIREIRSSQYSDFWVHIGQSQTVKDTIKVKDPGLSYSQCACGSQNDWGAAAAGEKGGIFPNGMTYYSQGCM